MTNAADSLLQSLKDPIQEIELTRSGLKAGVIEMFLTKFDLPVNDVLEKLNITESTYYNKKRNRDAMDSYTTEKFIRLIGILVLAAEVLGQSEVKAWLYSEIPSLGNEIPLRLLDTDTGHRLVENALLQVKYGVYG